MILTGTPLAANLEEEWAQLGILNEDIIGIRYVSAFRMKYCIMGGFGNKNVVGQKDVDGFKRLTAPHIFRVAKSEIGFTPKLKTPWPFDLADRQKEMIKQLKSEFRVKLKAAKGDEKAEKELAIEAGAIAGQIQQISSGFLYRESDDGERETHLLFDRLEDNPRIAALEEVLDQIDGPSIIWGRFHTDIELVAKYLEEGGRPFGLYYGPTKASEREAAIEDFNAGRTQHLVANTASAGTGLNLQLGGCTNAIYYTNSENTIDRWQSEDRIHRIGMRGTAQYWDLIAKQGRDRAIIKRFQERERFTSFVLDDFLEEIDE